MSIYKNSRGSLKNNLVWFFKMKPNIIRFLVIQADRIYQKWETQSNHRAIETYVNKKNTTLW